MCAHVLCDIQFFFHVQFCLQNWITHVKGRGNFFALISSQVTLSIYQSIAENFKVHNTYLRNQRIYGWLCGDVKGYQVWMQAQTKAKE